MPGTLLWNWAVVMASGFLAGGALDLSLPAGAALAASLGGALAPLPHHLLAWRLFRQRSRLPVLTVLPSIRPGAPVRLRGTVAETQQAFLAPGSACPAVFARTVYRRPAAEGPTELREELRGVPFEIRLQGGTRVRLDPTLLAVQDPPRRVKKLTLDARRDLGLGPRRRFGEPRYLQVLLAPGDAIEAVGCLGREVDPAGTALPGRGVPLVTTLAPGASGQVLVRKLSKPPRLF